MTAQLTRLSLARSMPIGLALLADPGFQVTPLVELENRLWLDLAAGRLDRAAVVAPPRHGKTYLGQYGLAWYLGNWPDKKAMTGSYNLDLARVTGRQVRDLLLEWGPRVFGVQIRGDTSSAVDWQTTRGGGLLAGGRRGGFTGRGANLIYLDDVFKDQKEAESAAAQDEAIRFLKLTLTTRLEEGGAILITNTRWVENDVVGYLARKQRDRWSPPRKGTLLRVPAIADGLDFDGKLPAPDPVGRSVGEPLWPARYPLAVLEDRRGEMGPSNFSTVMQGLPQASDGYLFQRRDFRAWSYTEDRLGFVLHRGGGTETVPRTSCQVASFMDLGATDEVDMAEGSDPDYTVISSWAFTPTGDMLLLDVARERIDSTKHEAMYDRARQKWGGLVHIERQFVGLALVQSLRKRGRPFAPVDADRNKVARARALQAKYALNVVFHPDEDLVREAATWLAAWEAELLRFPQDAHDDQVDTGSYAAAYEAKWVRPGIRSLWDDEPASESKP